MRRRSVSDVLRAARDKMNSSGAHWLKGNFKGIKRGELAYCSVGAIRAATPSPDLRNRAIIELARSIDPVKVAEWEKRGTGEPFYKPDSDGFRAYVAGNVAGIIYSWNDRDTRRWRDVDRKFRRVADGLEAQA